MKIDDLRSFCAVYKYRNFSDAADEMHLTQPAISKRIQALQRDAGVDLVDTSNKRQVRITESGESFYWYARSIVREYELMQSEIGHYRDLSRGHLWVGSIPVVSHYGFADVFTRFMHDYPSIRIRFEEIEGDELLSKLNVNSVDLGIVRDIQSRHLSPTVFRRVPVVRDELMAVLSADSPLANRGTVSMSDLADLDFVLLGSGSGVYETVMDQCHRAGFTPNVIFYSTHIDTLVKIARDPGRVTFLFDRAAQAQAAQGMRHLHLKEKVFSDLECVYPIDQDKESVRMFIDDVRDALSVS